jgi:hypothetical protein
MLQNMAEIMEYTSCLDAAATAEDPAERLARVAAFTMGPFAAVERPWKPFNPILGETFELRRPEAGVRFIAEQARFDVDPRARSVSEPSIQHLDF